MPDRKKRPTNERRPPDYTGYFHWPPIAIVDAEYDELEDADEEIEFSETDDRPLVLTRDLQGGLKVSVYVDGLFLFDFSGWATEGERVERGRAHRDHLLRRLTVLNAHLACLHTAIHYRVRKPLIDPANVVSSYDNLHLSCAAPWIPAVAHARDRTWAGWGTAAVILKTEIGSPSGHATVGELDASFNLLDALLGRSSLEVVNVAELLLRSCKAIEEHSHSSGLITAWAVCERELQALWSGYLDIRQRSIGGSGEQFISRRRREKLVGRDFSASVISEILSLAGRLPDEVFGQLNSTRRARNDWIHSLKPVSKDEAVSALEVAQAMVALVEGVLFNLDPSPFFANY